MLKDLNSVCTFSSPSLHWKDLSCFHGYASLRRRLLVDPHVMKDVNRSPDLAMDNPLSQNPEITWGRFFHHAEIEKMVDQDLSRLYLEEGNYFQTSACQGMLRRVLLLCRLRHPECGYGQDYSIKGMDFTFLLNHISLQQGGIRFK